MNLFEAVKDAVPTITAAEHYGIEVKRNGMACCPFHDDRTPSMKVDKRFHCFGCQEDGDVIDFVGKLFGLSPKRAAEKLAEDFGVRDDNSSLVLPYLTAEYTSNQDSFKSSYDEIEVCRAAAGGHFKSALQTRSREMVDRSDLVVCCSMFICPEPYSFRKSYE